MDRKIRYFVNGWMAWLEHKADRYTTVYGYMD